ncbi:MAG: hypothetical protein WA738_14815, partial [Candidatus Angelobacter sp.]
LSVALKERRSLQIWGVGTVAIVISGSLWFVRGRSSHGFSWKEYSGFMGIILLGLFCSIVFVATNRAMIRFSSRMSDLPKLILTLLINVFLGFLCIAPILWGVYDLWGVYHHNDSRSPWLPLFTFSFWASGASLFTSLSALSIVIVMLIALVHRVLWPFVERPIYAVARHSIVRKPALLQSIALVLLTWALPVWNTFWAAIGKIH